VAVGVVGVGRIGAPLVGRLVAAGHDVVATDVRPERRREVEQAGARWMSDADEVAGHGGVLLTVLPGVPELRDLVVGPGGLLSRLPAGVVWVDLTSASFEFGQECAPAALARGVSYLDAPIGGGVPAVRDGVATLYVGGDGAVVETALPVLHAFATTVHHVGGAGAGYLTKLLVNLLWFGHATLTTEVLLLARRHGQAPDRMRELLLGGAGSSAFIVEHLPALLAGDYLADFGLSRCVEELDSVERTAEQARVPHPVTSVVADVHRRALAHFGPVDGELMASAWLEQRAGFPLGKEG
jgi:3-hydroxyisobutyrate dehydrogenase